MSAGPRAPAVSVVVPVRDEADNVLPLHAELRRVLDALPGGCEILFVDDGSRDATAARLAEVQRRDPRVEVVRFRANRGQALALQAGFDRARGEVVVTLDGDLQNDPADIPRLLAGIAEGYDVVCGWRRRRSDAFWSRRLPSVVANRLIAALTGVALHDNGCTLRAYRREALRRTALYGELHRFVVPLLVRAGCRHREVEVAHRPRAAGRSKYGVARVWRVLLDLLTVKMLLGFAARPAVWFGWMSAPFAAAAAAALAASAWFYAAPHASGDFPVVLPSTAVLFACAALQLTALGLLAELVVKVGDVRARELRAGAPGDAVP